MVKSTYYSTSGYYEAQFYPHPFPILTFETVCVPHSRRKCCNAASDFLVKELKVSNAVAKQATKNRGPESYVFPNTEDIANLQKTADWLLEQKIIPQRVDITTAVCPLETTAAR